MKKTKQRNHQHLVDELGQRLLRQQLPAHWLLRDYRPDYGLDYALEIFTNPTKGKKNDGNCETLGEHIFVQLKSTQALDTKKLQLYERGNVEKGREELDKSRPVAQIETVRMPIDTVELNTIQRMGVGVPVMLVVADVIGGECYFVCLND